MIYALDTNIIAHLLRNTPSVILQYDEKIAKGAPIIIPPYVDFEVRRGLIYAKATAKELIYQRLCDSCEIGEMRRNIWVRAANLYSDIRRKGFTVGDADILIAAFCIENDCTLVTNNVKDFKNIDGLPVVDWVT
ncbi:MAG: PIN domain-containing protein [Oscillospiraceae bacterium]|nr:PIN domain-containing protein [Oscillospiraceae bacterium]